MVSDPSSPPWEDTVKRRRIKVSWRGRPITALSQGAHRAYLYPVLTPSGVAVTSEAPVDHPHQQSITIGTDRLDCIVTLPDPFSDTSVEATYNFWSDETMSGRAPGRIVGFSVETSDLADDRLRIVQTLHWHGPSQWGAPEGAVVAHETRTIDISPGEVANIIDIRSQLQPTEWDIRIGPTVHAYFTVRLADGLRVVDGGTLVDSEGRRGAGEIRGRHAEWVDCSGKAPHGGTAGITVFQHPSLGNPAWHLDDWGKVSVNPFVRVSRTVKRGEMLDLAVRIAAHDGDCEGGANISGWVGYCSCHVLPGKLTTSPEVSTSSP